MFNRNFLVYLAGSALAVGLAACGNSNDPSISSPQQAGASPTTQTVQIPMNAAGMGPAAFGTNPLVINAGDSVQWMNNDSVAHTSTSDTGVWDTGSIQPGTMSSPVPFPSPGTFPYHCSIHGAASMSGVVQVNGPSASPSASPSVSPSPSESVSPSPSPSESVSPSPSPSETVSPTPTETVTPVPTSTGVKQGPPATIEPVPVETVVPVNPGEGCDDDEGHHHDDGWCNEHMYSARIHRAQHH